MEERAFRLDFVIAIAALLVSAITTVTLIYQTSVIHDQYAVAVWPYLSVSTTWNPQSEVVKLVNDGLGPALIRSAQLSVDGKPLRAWNDYVTMLMQDRLVKHAVKGSRSSSSSSSIDASTIVRAGDEVRILSIVLPSGVPLRLLTKHKVALDFCYCSLSDSCWTLHSSPGSPGGYPKSVSRCTTGPEIDARVQP